VINYTHVNVSRKINEHFFTLRYKVNVREKSHMQNYLKVIIFQYREMQNSLIQILSCIHSLLIKLEIYPIGKGWCIQMFLSIDKSATAWFTKEFEFKKPFSIRMFPQYAGFGKMHKGYSLAFSLESPANIGYTNEVDGITFFVEGNDVWFFEDTETYLTFDGVTDEILVTYKELSSTVN